jgi:hypothetical protein
MEASLECASCPCGPVSLQPGLLGSRFEHLWQWASQPRAGVDLELLNAALGSASERGPQHTGTQQPTGHNRSPEAPAPTAHRRMEDLMV